MSVSKRRELYVGCKASPALRRALAAEVERLRRERPYVRLSASDLIREALYKRLGLTADGPPLEPAA